MLRSVLVAALLIAVQAYASGPADVPTKVGVALTSAYIPGGFDSNDRAQLVIEGYFPNNCYRIGPYEKKLNTANNEISISQTAYKYEGGPCLMMIVPFSQTVQVGILQANTYRVKDAQNGAQLGDLPVQAAKSSSPDDYLYASINDATISVVDGNKRAIVLQGELPGDCWELKDKRAVLDGKNVIAVLPIIEKVRENNCSDYRLPFVTTTDLPAVTPGRYLLHVRSLNGVAINKLVDL